LFWVIRIGSKYAFENLQAPNGLLYWGGHQAYDATSDEPRGRGVHGLKAFYPYYELMWEVDPQATKRFIEAFWSAHILDWSNLDFNRHAYSMNRPVREPWKYEYKGGPVFLETIGSRYTGISTGIDLVYAAAWLTKLSGDKEPLVWGNRLARRYINTRHPKTGIACPSYTKPAENVREPYDDVMRRFRSRTILVVAPYLTTLLALTVVCFGFSYVVFMKQEIRSI